MNESKVLKEGAAGLLANIVACSATQPFDTIKVRMQISGPSVYSNTLMCSASMIRHEGVLSLFKGLTPPLVTNGLIGSIVFSVHAETIRLLGSSQPVDHFVAGAVAGWVQCIVATPADLVKCRQQSIRSGSMTTLACIQNIVAARGISGLYHGNLAMLVRETTYGVYFASYDSIKYGVSNLLPEGNTAGEDPLWVSTFAGGMAGALCWTAIYPFDVVKSRIQTGSLHIRNPIKAISHVYQTEGFAPFKRGYLVTMVRSFPNNAIVFTVYELCRQWFGFYSNPKP